LVLLGNIDEGDSSSSSEREMLRGRQPLLSDSDVVIVFSPEEEEGPVDEDNCDEEMGDVSDLMSGRDVTESELVESVESGVGGDRTDVSHVFRQV
jgi:hypothetical protein